jgi:hypothetical protein
MRALFPVGPCTSVAQLRDHAVWACAAEQTGGDACRASFVKGRAWRRLWSSPTGGRFAFTGLADPADGDR